MFRNQGGCQPDLLLQYAEFSTAEYVLVNTGALLEKNDVTVLRPLDPRPANWKRPFMKRLMSLRRTSIGVPSSIGISPKQIVLRESHTRWHQLGQNTEGMCASRHAIFPIPYWQKQSLMPSTVPCNTMDMCLSAMMMHSVPSALAATHVSV